MKKIINGTSVELHYKGTFSNGEVFDDSRSRGSAMQVLVGSGQVLKGFDTALVGMFLDRYYKKNDYTKTISI